MIKEFAIGGICNCICGRLENLDGTMEWNGYERVDSEFAKQLVEDKESRLSIVRLLSSANENTLVSALTTLFYLLEYPQGISCRDLNSY